MTTQAEFAERQRGFAERCAAAAADLALYFVGAPDEQMLASLHQTRTNLNLEADLAETFGAEVATAIRAGIRCDGHPSSPRDRGCRRDVATVELKLAGGVSPDLSARCSAAADVTARRAPLRACHHDK